MSKQKLTAFALIAVLIASFTVLLSIGSEIYREKPPIQSALTSTNGEVLFSQNDVKQGQLIWRSMGGHQLGSIWGHGAYVAPDWTADWLHKEAQVWLDITANNRYQQNFSALTTERKAGLEQLLREDMRHNSVVETAGGNSFISLPDTRIAAFKQVSQHYLSLFGSDTKPSHLREQYMMKEGTTASLVVLT